MRRNRNSPEKTCYWIQIGSIRITQTMVERELSLPVGERIDFVSIVTPNRTHVPIAKAFLQSGFNVVCDKPLAFNLAEALDLQQIVGKTGKVFALTHNYTGYPMVKEARELVRKGELGNLLKVVVEYPQGWLINPIDEEGQKQAAWRTNPEQAGASSCVGDIGTHAENLARYITGLEIDEICADFTTFVKGRLLEDDANMLIRFKGGAKGVLYASQISVGEENSLSIRVYGTKGFTRVASGRSERFDREVCRRAAAHLSAWKCIPERCRKTFHSASRRSSGSFS